MKIEKRLKELERYYKDKIVKSIIVASTVGTVVGFFGGMLFFKYVMKP